MSCNEEASPSSWVKIELGGAEFGDERLGKRLLQIANDLSSDPEAAINQASRDWSAIKGAYRFFDNEKVSPLKILSPHREQTLARIDKEPQYCLAIQDTTYLNFNGHRCCNELGSIGTEKLKGIIAHTTLACSTEGLPLGILEQKLYTRAEVSSLSDKERKKLPITQKESIRWLESIRTIAAIKAMPNQDHKNKKIVTVCDREGDIAELLSEAENLGIGYLVRSSAPRKVLSTENQNIHEAVKQAPIAGQILITIPSRGGKYAQAAVKITANVQFLSVTLDSSNRKSKGKGLPTFIVRVFATKDEKILEWLLLTNIAVKNLEDAIERIRWYQLRWHIEIFHKILKSGCSIEAVRLNSVQKLSRCITLYSIIAWRIFFLTHLQRLTPELPSAVALSSSEIDALRKLTARKHTTLNVETLSGAVTAIAILGGYLNRNNDPDPGPIVIWRGYTKLQDALLTIQALQEYTCG